MVRISPPPTPTVDSFLILIYFLQDLIGKGVGKSMPSKEQCTYDGIQPCMVAHGISVASQVDGLSNSH